MTNEEAIRLIEDDKRLHHDYLSSEYRKALSMAIEALKAQNKGLDQWCSDCKEYDSEKHCCPRFNRVIRMALQDSTQTNAESTQSGKDINVRGKDTVYRQDAIDALYHVDEYNGRSVKAIMNLPSAEPDLIACGDCKHYICHDRRCGYWDHGVKPLDWCCHAERRGEHEND